MRLTPLLFLLLPLAAQAGVYKCLDNAGHVTYTNTVCDKSGLKEARLIPPPPPVAIDSPKAQQSARQSTQRGADRPSADNTVTDKSAGIVASREMPTMKLALNKTRNPESGNCARISEQIGKVMDEMDDARRAGNTGPQEAWTSNLSRLQAEKTRLGCF